MIQPRTVKMLMAMLGAMTAGAFLLYAISGDPIPPAHQAAVLQQPGLDDVVFKTDVPLRAARWRHVVVHSAPTATSRLAQSCHFIIGHTPAGVAVQATPRWRNQLQGVGLRQIQPRFNAESISICLVGDFSTVAPDQTQFAALLDLTRILQADPFLIPAGHVYLRRDLDSSTTAPGQAFPVDSFSRKLLRPIR